MGQNAASPRLAVLNVVGLTRRFLRGDRLPRIRSFVERANHGHRVLEPILPAVTSTVQASFLTGQMPNHHGIVANGWYDRDRAEHLFWKQSDHLVRGPKVWEVVRQTRPDLRVARLFWWNNMFSSVDYSITPRPIYRADGGKIFDITASPLEIRDRVKADLGPFPFRHFWGPASGIESSRWIAQSARWIEEHYAPDLNLVYLPHLDYNLQKLGPRHSAIDADLTAIDEVTGELIDALEARGVEVLLLSEYGITPVDRPIHLNRLFRKQGWLEIKEELGTDTLELGACAAFAIADHQVAHVYVQDPALVERVADLLRETRGITQVLDRNEQKRFQLDHPRSGDLIAIADERSWFTYYFWEEDDKAPDYARTVDIHRKPGYDPVELFLESPPWLAKARILFRLAQKKLGFRMLMDVIPLDATLVRGSHGCRPEEEDDWPVLAGRLGEESAERPMHGTQVFEVIRRKLLGQPL
ncbi:MAG: putative pyrophosphatase or phosphodiesterase, AlkP superfamily [Verrucomicrobia bacterium]|jgi:predicted AlkP superfamily pyrophosphatase or phosphodiesterase|nr:MAG: putative pyrophosphatase or phosphodiesterase, AlkP superfamily [Verrucomicrobiota bacterium]